MKLRTHDGDCSFYSALANGRVIDGICTCGYGMHYFHRTNDCSQLYSNERLTRLQFDTKSAPRFDKAVELANIDEVKKKLLQQCSERCESGLFSAYLDSAGKYWHCSFGEGMEVAYGIDVTKVKDFGKEVWLSSPMTTWRNKLWELNRECPLYSKIHVEERAPFEHEIKAQTV